jgi:hypothetical protein
VLVFYAFVLCLPEDSNLSPKHVGVHVYGWFTILCKLWAFMTIVTMHGANNIIFLLGSWPVNMGPTRCPETSVNNYHTTPCNHPKDHRLQYYIRTFHFLLDKGPVNILSTTWCTGSVSADVLCCCWNMLTAFTMSCPIHRRRSLWIKPGLRHQQEEQVLPRHICSLDCCASVKRNTNV